MNERFLYEIKPVRPISLPGKPKMKHATCALLTKEEVMEYMKYGAIYRKYADPNMPPVRVTGENIHTLHKDPTVIPNKPAKAVADIFPTEIVEPAKVEEEVVEGPVVDIVEEPKKENEEESTMTEESAVESSDDQEEVVTEEPVVDDAPVETNDGEDVVEVEEEEVVEPEKVEETETVSEDSVEADTEVSEEAAESEVQEVEAESASENNQSSNNDYKKYNNKKHKNSNNIQFSNTK